MVYFHPFYNAVGTAFRFGPILLNLDHFPNVHTFPKDFGGFQTGITIKYMHGSYITVLDYLSTTSMKALIFASFPNVKTMGANGFLSCPALKYLILGDLTNGMDNATRIFESSNLAYIKFNFTSTHAWMNNNYSWSGFANKSTKIYIPDELVDTIKATTFFSKYASKIYPSSQWLPDCIANNWMYELPSSIE